MYQDKAYNEIMILAAMDHPNVNTLYEYFECDKYITIILNQEKGKPLLMALEEFKKDYTTKRILKIIWQLSKAIRHLKAKDIIWCNFHHNNIIYDGEDVVICDFSESRLKVKRDKKQAQNILGLRGKNISN
jgi:serine/threonine protein kinase